MILRPKAQDFLNIGHYLGSFSNILGFLMLIPLATALIFQEWNPALDILAAASICFILGIALNTFCPARGDLSYLQAMLIAGLCWLVAMFLGALPLYFSGHFKSYLDACFDAMSGFATTGLALIQNADHISNGINMWRHLIMFIGGQGIIVVGLTFLIRGFAGAFRLYVGEARDEKIFPNVIQTARFIWQVSIVYLILGTCALFLVGIFEGMDWIRSFFHGMWVFMAAFDTGGFTPQSQSILYYHSVAYEIVAMIIMIFGTLNFALHYTLWSGNWREIYRNIEIRTISLTILLTQVITVLGLFFMKTFQSIFGYFRFSFFQVISGHSGTGYMTIYASQFINQWGELAMVGLIIAMGLGGCICSTAGGIKALRVAISTRSIWQDIKTLLLSDHSVLIEKFHHIKDTILTDKLARSALMILLCYLLIYFIGAVIGVVCGYQFLPSLFESVSAAANVGLTCGVTATTMPALLKITYIIEMWAGRLEFLSIFVLGGLLVAMVKGK